jgi:hypothetical protein
MTAGNVEKLKDEIARLEAAASAAAEKRAEQERRHLNLPSQGTTRWRIKHRVWLARFLAFALHEERLKRQPQIDRLRRKLDRLKAGQLS